MTKQERNERPPQKRRPTRRDLLIVIGRLQGAIGHAMELHANDRDPHGFEEGQKLLKAAFDLCVEVRSHDPPLDGAASRRGWGRS